MSLLGPSTGKKKAPQMGSMSLLLAVPTILIAAPGVGFFLGQWADKKFGTDPYLLIVGLILGFGAAGIEIMSLVKKSQAMEEKKDDD